MAIAGDAFARGGVLSRIAEKWTPVFGQKSCEIKGG